MVHDTKGHLSELWGPSSWRTRMSVLGWNSTDFRVKLKFESWLSYLTFSEPSCLYFKMEIIVEIIIITFLFLKKIITIFFLKKRFYLFIFRERGKGGRKRGRETSMCGCLSCAPLLETWPATQACALDWESNWRPFALQARTQSTVLCQPGQIITLI